MALRKSQDQTIEIDPIIIISDQFRSLDRENVLFAGNQFLNVFRYIPFFYAIAFCLFFFSTTMLSSQAVAEVSEEQISKRVHAHMVIGDYTCAAEEAQAGLQVYPDSKLLWQCHIYALAKGDDEKLMMAKWRQLIEKFPEERDNREILECLAWSVIEKGSTSSSPIIRATAMLGACFSQDAKGVVILQNGLQDENSFLRSAAIKLSSLLHDTSLQEEILRLFKTEAVWRVRLEAIKAVGELNMVDARPGLINIISQQSTHAEEKAAAIESLVKMSDGIEKEQISQLVKSDRAGMRLLACEMMIYFEQREDIDILMPLIFDPHSEVRAKIFETLGRLRIEAIDGQSVIDIATKGISDPDPLVAITAAWVLMLNDQNQGDRVFEMFLRHKTSEVRYLAAAALAASGKYGLPLTKKVFKENLDPYVRMNLSLGLIGQRTDTVDACHCLYAGLNQQKERWDWNHEGSFRILAPSKVKHDEAIPNYPEAVNQLTRLEMLSILAIVHFPYAQQAIKTFLQERSWGISGIASALLLTEGDEDAVDLVKQLLNDKDKKVKVQAALILALWGNGEDAVQLLQDAYASADRELKGQILEGIGRVGSPNSLVFLAERLQEPYQTLRIIAAAALLECLYH